MTSRNPQSAKTTQKSRAATGRQMAARAQAGVRREVQSLMRDIVSEMGATLQRYAGADGKILRRDQQLARDAVLLPLRRAFVGTGETRLSFDDKGLAVSPYARILQRWYVNSVVGAVRLERTRLKKQTPKEIYAWLAMTARRTLQQTEEKKSPYDQGDDESSQDYYARLIRELHVVHKNPFAEIDPNRQWVPFTEWEDSNGYRLSDRVWLAENDIRAKIDKLLARGLQLNKSAIDLAKALEAYLVPTQTGIRTLKPYGPSWRPDAAAYAAMRLARTELSRAFNHAAYTAAYLNPYVDRIDIARSPNGDPDCKICPQHATLDIGGRRLRPAYDKSNVTTGPYHPHCQCSTRPVVSDTPETVTQNLRALLQNFPETEPAPNAATDLLIDSLLGQELSALWRRNGL